MADSIQTILNQANAAIASIGSSLVTLQTQSDILNTAPITVNTVISGANTANVPNPYYTKAESDILFLSTTGGVITGNVTVSSNIAVTNVIATNVFLSGLYYANGTPFSSGGGSISSVNGVIDLSTTANAALVLPTGTTAQRPANAANGSIRWNTSNNVAEVYVGNNYWQIIASSNYLIDYLLVAGGGGGGTGNGGAGGGAGGMIEGFSVPVVPGTAYQVSVGAGGAVSSSGTNSTFYSQISIGGGYGAPQGGGSGGSGGSGGGAYGSGGSGSVNTGVGSGTAGQGNPGGYGWLNNSYDGGGGGGGAGGSGGNGGNNYGGAGGVGKTSPVGSGAGVSSYFAGGGGGGSYIYASPSSGGSGVGGSGGVTNGPAAGSGVAGTGSGGGGAGGTAGAGGSGIVIVRYAGTQRGQGGTVTSNAGYTYHKFTGSGTFIA